MHHVDLERYPLDRPGAAACEALIAACRATLADEGMFNLPGFFTSSATAASVAAIGPRIGVDTFRHARRHNIYFKDAVAGLERDHPALQQRETVNHTLCADQLDGTPVADLYGWQPFADFLAAVMGRQALHPMADPLAGVNVMGYRAGEALNWHFDRSEFTTTLLLQAPEGGGMFEYARDLRRDDAPNHAGVADLLEGRLAPAQMAQDAGTLNVFKGKNTAHRVTPVTGSRARIVAVFSYFDRPGVVFSPEERIGFYGRAA